MKQCIISYFITTNYIGDSNNFVISVRVNPCNYLFEFTIGVGVNIQNSNCIEYNLNFASAKEMKSN